MPTQTAAQLAQEKLREVLDQVHQLELDLIDPCANVGIALARVKRIREILEASDAQT